MYIHKHIDTCTYILLSFLIQYRCFGSLVTNYTNSQIYLEIKKKSGVRITSVTMILLCEINYLFVYEV